MEVILKERVEKLGHKNDLVTVKAGYARNYLIPKGLAEQATSSSKKLWAENATQRQHKIAKQLNEAQQLATTLKELHLTIHTKASEKGSIYGSITTTQVADALKEKGHVLAPKYISFEAPIKTLGKHQALVRLHKEVIQEIDLNIEQTEE